MGMFPHEKMREKMGELQRAYLKKRRRAPRISVMP